jgi:hypothetical protein
MRKKIIAVVLSFMLAIPVVGVGFAYANATKVGFSFSFGAQANLEHTPARQKDSYSSAYMVVNSIPANKSYVASVWGRTSTNGSDLATSPSGASYYFTGAGTWYNMVNYVKESGYPIAVVRAAQNATYSFSASGQWGADI